MTARARVLIVDDSAFTRKVVREVLEAETDLEVIGVARDGLEALEKIAQLSPDVITLDLVMPNLDGVGVLRQLRELSQRGAPPPPRVVVVSMSGVDTELGAEALQLGAVDIVSKPTALASSRLYEMASTLRATVRLAIQARPLLLADPPDTAPATGESAPRRPSSPSTRDLVAIGTSTGGPQALTRLLTSLPADLPVPVVVALHIPAGYTEALARRLDEACEVNVVEASNGCELVAGTVVLARGGEHLTVVREEDRYFARLRAATKVWQYTPSVDELFESAARAYGSRVLGVVLTGMGDDGLEGARAIRAAGGDVIGESPYSCVVYGMPRSVKEAGLVSGEYRIDDIGRAILSRLA